MDSLEEDDTDEENMDKEEKNPKKKSALTAKLGDSIIGYNTPTKEGTKKGNKKSLYSVQFNNYLPEGEKYFAAVGAVWLSIYECPPDDTIRLVMCFQSETLIKTPELVNDRM